jgi:hypothetical protein
MFTTTEFAKLRIAELHAEADTRRRARLAQEARHEAPPTHRWSPARLVRGAVLRGRAADAA